MKVNELRIGNLFHPCDTKSGVCVPNSSIVWRVGMIDKFGKIAVIEPEQHDTIYLTINECSPIPLTEDWLVKFGFNQNYGVADGEQYMVYQPIWIYEHERVYYSESYDDYFTFIKTIQYVHQLQNLYFAITGEELTIK